MVKCEVLVIAMFDCSHGRMINFYTFKNSKTISSTQGKEEGKENGCGRHYKVVKLKSGSIPLNERVASLPHSHIFSGYASLGGQIYRVGGRNLRCSQCTPEMRNAYSRGMDTVDGLSYAGGSAFTYFCLPSMLTPREDPKVVFAAGKLFVIGGSVFSDAPLTTFVEYYDPLVEEWFRFDNPDDSLGGLSMDLFVCGVLREDSERDMILVGSPSNEHFIALVVDFDATTGGIREMKWIRTRIKFDNRKLFNCHGSPAAVVDSESRRMMWLDCMKPTRLVVLCCDTGLCYEFNLGKEGLLPSPNCMHYNPKLLSLGGDLLGLVWKDKIHYKLQKTNNKRTAQGDLKGGKGNNINEVEELGRYHLTKFRVIIGGREKKLVIDSHIRCVAPGGRRILVDALTLDLPCDV